jgi:hypothetical protein
MEAQAMKSGIERLEQCADEAKQALQAGSVSDDLRQCVETLHQRASQAKHGPAGQEQLRQSVLQIEQAADRAMDACRKAGQVDPRLQQAIQRAHTQASELKKQMQATTA